jgi:hypothetical protein
VTPTDRFVWLDRGWWLMRDGQRRLLSWNAETKEVSFWALDRFQENVVLAKVATEDEVLVRLADYDTHCDSVAELRWLAEQLEGCLTRDGAEWLLDQLGAR